MSIQSDPLAGAASDAPFDLRHHQEEFVANGLGALLAEILPAFALSAAEKYARMEESLRASNFTELAAVSHSLKGEAATVGAPPVRRCAAAIEEAARTANADLAAELLPLLGDEVRKVAAVVAVAP